ALAPLPGEVPGRFFLATTDAIVSYDWSAGPVFRAPLEEKPLALATKGALLVVSGAERTLIALDARNGSAVWRFIGRGGFHAAAVFRDDSKRLFIGDDAGEFYSLSTDKGEIDFRWSTGAAIRSSALVEGNRVYVASFGNNLYAYDSGGGSEQWRARLPGRPASTPIRVNQRLLVTTLDGTLVEVETGRGHLGKSHVLPGELLMPASAWIEAPPMTGQPFVGTEPKEAETPDGETTPRWFERSRIAAVIRTGDVILLRHQSESPPMPTPSTEDSTVPR
ncbi:MAG TPA: PQQ-binding-like beta-propeller repeat protein, partial [Vicinamibacteria bacterium]|nr:PQQ-binding-like beta-propeller repeat protein [Vicinamibacteria bacterium]